MHHRLLFFIFPHHHRRGHQTSARPLLVVGIIIGLLALLLLIGYIGSAWDTAHTPDAAQTQARALSLVPTIDVSGTGFTAQDTANDLTVSETLSAQQADLTAIQNDCYQVESALWQDSQVNGVAGIQLDVYEGSQEVGVCNLSKQTAQGIAWNAASPDEVWGMYDTTWISPGI